MTKFHRDFSLAANAVGQDGNTIIITGDDWTFTVTNNGEPGRNDLFGITFTGYSIGSTQLGNPVKQKGGGNIKVR